MTRLLAALVMAACLTSPTQAYLKLGTSVNGKIVDTTWAAPGPIPYFISEQIGRAHV